MNVILISPGYPAEMPHFTRALARTGATVLGLGDQPPSALAPDVRRALAAYEQVADLWDEEAVIAEIRKNTAGRRIHRVECLWEPGMVLAAKLRVALGASGMGVEQTLAFRDKERMKQVLDAAGIRTPHHYRCKTAGEIWAAAGRIGWPVIVKPIAGAGSADTYTARSEEELSRAIEWVRHVPEVSVEEYVEGEEHTFDTVCAGGRVLFENIAWYRPKPLTARLNEWISPQAVCLKDIEAPELRAGRELGHRVLRALGFDTGFTHMEWYRTKKGEAIFGEIGARPPGGRLVHVMNYSCDGDLFAAWASAVVRGGIEQDLRKRFNAGVVFKRARGGGSRITRYDGLDSLLRRFGPEVAHVELNPIGAPRRDWRQEVVADGWIVIRHPDLGRTLEVLDRFGAELEVRAD